MLIDILTLFPGYFESPFSTSLLAKARAKGVLEIQTVDIRDFSSDKHRTVDASPYGGGAGMVMCVEPIHQALRSVQGKSPRQRVVYLGPSGTRMNHCEVKRLAAYDHLILLAGRYEGVDQRIIDHYVDETISIGDYIVFGGEVAAMVLVEAVARFVPGVLGNPNSLDEESHSSKGNLEYPHYTRPPVYDGYSVPEVLLSGNHEAIRKWRDSKSSTSH